MYTKRLFLIAACLFLSAGAWSQCYDNNCDDDNDIPIPGCCTATTAGMTWSGYGDVNCVNMGSGIPDVWVSFTAPTTGYIDITIDNLTQNGPTQFVVFDHNNAEVCASLNSFGILAGEGCATIPGDGPGGVTYSQTVQYAVEAGERYWVLVSADVTNGATAGTFEICIALSPIPPPPPPQPGQDCITADVLCNPSASGFTVPVLDLGDGAVEENTLGGWSTCIGNETSSQWYTFTASSAGSFNMLLEPASWTPPQTGDDFDWELYDITASGCTNAAVSLACDYSACVGSTGFSATGAAGLGQVAGVDYQNNNPPGPGDCLGGPQWNTTSVNFVAGNTYALMIQNYSGSLGGVTATFGGTAIMGPVPANADFTSNLISSGCEAELNLVNSAIPNYTYVWDFGDGTTFTGSNPPDHFYSTPGTYLVGLTVTDALGCTVSSSVIIDVANCTVLLPVGLVSFKAQLNGDKDKVDLTWVTNSEENNDYFTVEKSVNGVTWEKLGDKKGAGNSTIMQYYEMRDDLPYFPVTYYRLRQTDFSGAYKYSEVVTTTYDAKMRSVLISHLAPNPAKEYLSFAYTGSDFDNSLTVDVFNELGQKMYSTEISDIFQNMQIAIDTREFGNGVYQLLISQKDASEVQKFVVLR